MRLEEINSGLVYDVIGAEDELDAAMRWARERTIDWWRRTCSPCDVLVGGKVIRISLSFDLDVEQVKT
jgi:hypothetical protein